MIRPISVTGLVVAFLFAAHAHAHACAPQSAVELKADDGALFKAYADIQLKALSIPFNVDLYFCGDGIENIERIKVDAVMPAHQHGMNYTPKVSRSKLGVYQVSGMFFHMPGMWELQISTQSASEANKTSHLFTVDITAR